MHEINRQRAGHIYTTAFYKGNSYLTSNKCQRWLLWSTACSFAVYPVNMCKGLSAAVFH